MNECLADTADLYSQIKHAHWSVKGLNFFQLHELFDQLAGEVLPFIDLIAGRATALGGLAMGTVRMAASNSTLPEYPVEATDGQEHLKALTDRYAVFTTSIRKASVRLSRIGMAGEQHDRYTADLFTKLSRTVDKQLLLLELARTGSYPTTQCE